MKKKLIFKAIAILILGIIIMGNMAYAQEEKENTIQENKNIENSDPLEIKYEYDKVTNRVTAIMISKIELMDTKPTWTLSSDKLTYTKVFDTNMEYTTPVVDVNGNVIQAFIKVTRSR